MNDQNQWIVINGDPIKGFRFYGAFDSHDQAQSWGLINLEHSGFVISELNKPTKSIEEMSHSEYLAYRENKIEAFLALGNELTPDPNCPLCDVANDYVCFTCECYQLSEQ
jgi:hypothetical protein